MNGYGQVYQTACPEGWPHGNERFPYGMAWRGVIMDEDNRLKEVWGGLAVGHPDAAFEAMQKAAAKLGCTDLRRWSGDLPEEPKWQP